ncbi:alginate lyase family protein [Vibrio sp. 404]|uniref:Alginate lyase family protein n=1 Tax=Vibrio marinisediminis TaxID=2758441 RepID=A0A7W2FRD7_9VIBR|nr:heparinase II/III family protein [Vibrio marinisediminis]MBA5762792.1 alginate lyase family protein [Vibrio marinisediminis]
MLEKIKTLFNTVKYLRFEQVFFRFLYKFKKPNITTVNGINIDSCNWHWSYPASNEQSFFSNRHVCFLSLDGDVGAVNSWNDPSMEKLWLYNLHYFDDLNAIDFDKRQDIHIELMTRWIHENPPCIGNGWEPYPLSLRIVNWVKWLSKRECIDQIFLSSLIQQADALSQQLEYHILGNHLFANGKALTFIGCFLYGEESRKFLDIGLKILDREIPEQFLSDGAHFELSPMYHEIVLWDLLELIDLAETSQNTTLLKRLPYFKQIASRALNWLQNMVHPDGEIAFFNDSAIGIATSPTKIFEYAKSLGFECESEMSSLVTNKDSGYSRLKSGDNVLLFDHGNIGPDYLPGHAHADSLSFELSIGNQRLFVNSGTSLYGVGSERLRQRSTPAHNTVVIDDENSSEVWSGFRVARRARSKLLNNGKFCGGCFVEASHDGYLRLRGRVVHTRRIDVAADRIVIADKLEGSWVSARAHYHIHPDVEVNADGGYLNLVLPNGECFSVISSDKFIIDASTWHPKFGESIPNKKLIYTFSDAAHSLVLKRIK